MFLLHNAKKNIYEGKKLLLNIFKKAALGSHVGTTYGKYLH